MIYLYDTCILIIQYIVFAKVSEIAAKFKENIVNPAICILSYIFFEFRGDLKFSVKPINRATLNKSIKQFLTHLSSLSNTENHTILNLYLYVKNYTYEHSNSLFHLYRQLRKSTYPLCTYIRFPSLGLH